MDKLSFDSLPQAVNQLSAKLDRIEKLLSEKAENNHADDLMTIEQAAEFLSLTKPTLYSKVSKGELPYMKKAKRLYFSRSELTEYLQSGRVKTDAEILDSATENLKQKK